MRELSLFTGIGGGLLGTHGLLGWQCVGAVEWEEYPCKVLRQRQIDGALNEFPIWNMDIREFNRHKAAGYTGLVDVITAGFPCQPFSLAGKQRGADDERNMWPATIDCIRVVRPRYVLLENVPGLISNGYLATVLGDLAGSGYDARWRRLSAAELGAPHRRDRLWIVAYASSAGRTANNGRGFVSDRNGNCPTHEAGREIKQSRFNGNGENVPNPHGPQQGWREQQKRGQARRDTELSRNGAARDVADAKGITERAGLCSHESGGKWRRRFSNGSRPPGKWWATEPRLDRVANGVPDRVDRLKAIGNGQVPAVAAAAWLLLTEGLT